ncbi:MAG: LysR family transcriptional regulator, partial [Xanthomonadales bacterium]|nr:LysR family transcriptional regulator [Xanthomonadales bacterium]
MLNRINLRDLELVKHLSDTGTIIATSQRMHVSQPAVSQRLRYLQDRVDIPLFERGDGRIQPTAAGRRLDECARQILQILEETGRELEQLAIESETRLRLTTQWSPRWSGGLRVTNLLDEDYAERADFGFGEYRYFVGQPLGA